MNTEIKGILGALEELNNASGFNVFIPSLNKDVKFKQLSTEQLKNVLKSVVDSPIYNSQFITSFNKIISENCLDESIDTKLFNIYDKLFILFKTRIESISLDYTFELTEEEIQQHNLTQEDKKKTVNLIEHFTNFSKKQYKFLPEIIDWETCSLTCDLPSIDTENKLEKELHKNIKIEVESAEELRDIVGDTFINEITKCISKINIKEEVTDLTTLDFKTRIKIVEQLPINVINKVIKFIENYRNKTKELTSISIGGLFEKDFPQDATFFNI
jgi:hypothetical protein